MTRGEQTLSIVRDDLLCRMLKAVLPSRAPQQLDRVYLMHIEQEECAEKKMARNGNAF